MEAQVKRPAPAHLDARDGWNLALLGAAFVVSRLAWLAWNPESAVYWEESYRWLAAHEILTGPVQPLLDYQADHYQGGSLVMILLIVPFFLLFGESFLTFKLSALVVSTATLGALYVLGRAWFARPVGVLAALGYLAGPPLVAYWGVVPFGSHGESVFFSLLLFYGFFGLLAGAWRTPRGWLVFGFVSGLGLWFCFTLGLSLAACAITWLLVERVPRLKELLWATAGGLLGLVPWFVYNVRYDFVGFTRILEFFGLGNPMDRWVPQGTLDKLVQLVLRDLPVGLLLPFESSLPPALFVALTAAFIVPLFVAIAVAAGRAAGLFRRGLPRRTASERSPDEAERCRELVVVVYGIVFLVGFGASAFTVEAELGPVTYRLFLPAAVLLMFLAAGTAARALSAGGWTRGAAVAGCALYLTASTAGLGLLVTRTPDASQRRFMGIAIAGGSLVRGLLLHRKFERDLGRSVAEARRVVHPKLRIEVLRGIGWGLEHRFETSGTVQSLRRRLRSIEVAERAHVLSGMHEVLEPRFRQLSAQIAQGDESGRRRVALRRLRLLQALVNDELRRIPAQFWPEGEIPSLVPSRPSPSAGASEPVPPPALLH